jgi:hypothetical protein
MQASWAEPDGESLFFAEIKKKGRQIAKND